MKYSEYIQTTNNREWINIYPWLNEWALNEFANFDLMYDTLTTDRLINNNIIDNILEIEKINSVVNNIDLLKDKNSWGDSNLINNDSVGNSSADNVQNYQGFNALGVFAKDGATQQTKTSSTTKSQSNNLLNILISLKNNDLLAIYKNIAKTWRSLIILCYNI